MVFLSKNFPQVWKREGNPNHVEVVWQNRTQLFEKVNHSSGDDHITNESFLLQGDAKIISRAEKVFAESERGERSEFEAYPLVIYNQFSNQDDVLTIVYKNYTEDYRVKEEYYDDGHMVDEVDDLESYYRGNNFHRVGTKRYMSPSRFSKS